MILTAGRLPDGLRQQDCDELSRDGATGELTKRVLRQEPPIAGSYDEQACERYCTLAIA